MLSHTYILLGIKNEILWNLGIACLEVCQTSILLQLYTVLSVCGLSHCLTNLLDKPPWFMQTTLKWLTTIYWQGTDECHLNNERTHLNNELGFGRSMEKWLAVCVSSCYNSKAKAEQQQGGIQWTISSLSASFAQKGDFRTRGGSDDIISPNLNRKEGVLFSLCSKTKSRAIYQEEPTHPSALP